MDNRPIGIFDSGLGGLTAVKEILSILPQEDIVYFGDTGRVPYGTRSKETIMKYAKQDMAFLQSKNVKMIIAACGTVSSVAGHIGEALSLPFTGVLKPTALAACLATHKKRIGIIGTTATIKSGSYQKAILEINPGIQVFAQDCPLFVPLVENGFTSPDSDIVLSVIKHYLQPFMDADIDTKLCIYKKEEIASIVLGCTHYPILYHAIEKVMGKGVFLVDSGKETAVHAADILEEQGLLTNRSRKGTCTFYVSDSTDGFTESANIFLQQNVEQTVEFIDIEAFSQSQHVK